MTPLPMTSETCESTFGDRTTVALENFVRLLVMRETLKLQSRMRNHMDGS